MAGIERVRIVEADGETIVAVRRTGLTPEQKKLLAYYDNRTAELALWNADQVLADLDAGLDLSGVWWESELKDIIGDVSDVEFPEYDEDVADDVEYIECPKCGYKWPK